MINITLFIFAALMIWASVSDIRRYILSNKLCLSVALLYPVFIFALYLNNTPPTWEYIAYSIGIAIIIFTILLILFSFNLIGGGDVKLIPAVALWAGPSLTIKFLLITTICGGIVSLAIIGYRYVRKTFLQPKSSGNVNLYVSESSKLIKKEDNIPYGVAISAGGLFVALELFKALN